jgi:uncharacterized protein
MKRRLTLLFVLTSLIAGTLFAQTQQSVPATRADILKLLDVMDTKAQVRQTMQQVMAQSQVMAHQAMKKRHPEMTAEQLARMDRESAEIAKTYPVDTIIEDMIPVYQKHLTKADVDAMIAFYSSPSGKKILQEMPSIMAESMEAVYPRLQKNMDDILRRLDEKADAEEKAAPPPKKQ